MNQKNVIQSSVNLITVDFKKNGVVDLLSLHGVLYNEFYVGNLVRI